MKTLRDLQAPATVTRHLLEKDVQKQCVDWARARGYWARKFSSQSQRSVPDYLFARTVKVDRYTAVEDVPIKFAVEFKRPGKTSTPAQQEEQESMANAGWHTFECDNFEYFKKMVETLERCA